jgi:hypothetical protein
MRTAEPRHPTLGRPTISPKSATTRSATPGVACGPPPVNRAWMRQRWRVEDDLVGERRTPAQPGDAVLGALVAMMASPGSSEPVRNKCTSE